MTYMFMGIGEIDMKKILFILLLIPSLSYAQYDRDMLGVQRNGDGNWDRGAYEFVGGVVTTTPSTSTSSSTTTTVSTGSSTTTTYLAPPTTTTTESYTFSAPNNFILKGGTVK